MTIQIPDLRELRNNADSLLRRVLIKPPEVSIGPCEVEFEDEARPATPDGNCLQFVSGEYLIVPVQSEAPGINVLQKGGTQPVLKWRVSGPHIDGGHCMTTGEPLDGPESEDQDCDTFYEALGHFAAIYTMDQLFGHAVPIMEREEAEALAEEAALAVAWVMEG